MKKEDAQTIAKELQENLKPLTATYFAAEESNGEWKIGRKPNYGSEEYIEKHTIIWKDEITLIMYLIGYAST